MLKYTLPKDISVVCITASSFPEGVKAAHDKLHELLPAIKERTCYGISHGSIGNRIVYKAAASEAFEGEGKKYDLESLVIRKGEYLGVAITGWMKHTEKIGMAFQELLAHPEFDNETP